MSRHEQYSLRQHSHRLPEFSSRRDHQPSFSSTLLDAIYRSLDDSSEIDQKHITKVRDNDEQQIVRFQQLASAGTDPHIKYSNGRTMTAKSSSWKSGNTYLDRDRSTTTEGEKIVVGRSDQDRHRKSLTLKLKFVSPTISSRGFSPCDAQTDHPRHTSLKPIRMAAGVKLHDQTPIGQETKKKDEEAKSRAMKICAKLKRAKQSKQISPGGRLAAFLNSLFAGSGKGKKMKTSTQVREPRSPGEDHSSSCSTASSLSRSCLTKTPSSAGRSEQKRPVSVIVGEDSRPCDEKSVYGNVEEVGEEFEARIMETRRVEKLAREFLKNYRKKKGKLNVVDDDKNEEDDSDRSCCSLDLFELPVYGTTHVDASTLAIVNGI